MSFPIYRFLENIRLYFIVIKVLIISRLFSEQFIKFLYEKLFFCTLFSDPYDFKKLHFMKNKKKFINSTGLI